MAVEIRPEGNELNSSPDPRPDTVQLVFGQTLQTTIGEGGDQLSKPQTNLPAELSIPREIISSSVSSSTLQSELIRPIFAGTYHNKPAYLVRLQFQLVVHGPGWLSTNIKSANINVLLKDAPGDTQSDLTDIDTPHPSIVKCFPGPGGWEGRPTKAKVTETRDMGLKVGWDAVGASVGAGHSRTKIETGAVKVMTVRKGRHRDNLIVTVAEDSVDTAGIPQYLTIPIILTHNNRRFSMRVTVNARYGFWRGKLAEMVPVLGRTDEPLYFDPSTMERKMKAGEEGSDATKIVEWRGELEDIDLRDYCSLTNKTAI